MNRDALAMSGPKTLQIFTDCTCPWCYFMSRKIARLKREYHIKIRRRAFPFHNDAPSEGISVASYFDDDPFIIHERMQALEKAAEDEALPFQPPQMIYNSRPAQEMVVWARTRGKESVFFQMLYRAYFVDGRNVSNASVLMDLAQSVGLPKDDALTVIETHVFASAVDRDWELAQELNIMVLPTFLMDSNRLVGAHPYHKLERFVRENGASKLS